MNGDGTGTPVVSPDIGILVDATESEEECHDNSLPRCWKNSDEVRPLTAALSPGQNEAEDVLVCREGNSHAVSEVSEDPCEFS